jgi:uncharacterized membrane protein
MVIWSGNIKSGIYGIKILYKIIYTRNMSTYNYSITTDFSGNYRRSNFIYEIYQSSLKPYLSELNETGDNVEVKFNIVLDAGQEATLNNLVATHDANFWVKNYNDSIIDETVSSTTSTAFQQKLRLTTEYLIGGTYKISWYYNWRTNNRSRDFKGRVIVDTTTTILTHQQEPKDIKSDQNLVVSGFYIITLTKGIHTIDIDYCVNIPSATSYISNARLEIHQIS